MLLSILESCLWYAQGHRGAARAPGAYDPATAYAQDGSYDAYLQANIAAQVLLVCWW